MLAQLSRRVKIFRLCRELVSLDACPIMKETGGAFDPLKHAQPRHPAHGPADRFDTQSEKVADVGEIHRKMDLSSGTAADDMGEEVVDFFIGIHPPKRQNE